MILNPKHLESQGKQEKIPKIQAIYSKIVRIAFIGSFLLFGLSVHSKAVEASFLTSLFGNSAKHESAIVTTENSQTMELLHAPLTSNLDTALGGGDITIVSGDALLPETGPSGSIADIQENDSHSDQISVYEVHTGDTLPAIAKMFDVTVNTIIWANDLSGGKITVGQKLVILPVSGVKYIVKTGDTLKTIAKKFKADEKEILQFNDLVDGQVMSQGDTIIIPDGEIDQIVPVKNGKNNVGTSHIVKGYSGPNYAGYYIRPLIGGIKTQGIHGYNAVDIGTPLGTPIRAAADGVVIISKNYGWNGGYGNYVAIKHENGTETLYGHLTTPLVTVGQSVEQGERIGLSGSTGKSTGPHLHFEIRGAVNPF